MKEKILILILLLNLIGCKSYSFKNIDIGDAKTIQIDFFNNQATLIEPTLSQKFTEKLQDLFVRQTKLTLTNFNADLYFSGEITEYKVTPLSGLSNQTAAQNRLTIIVNVRFENKLNDSKNFDKKFSFYSDFSANEQLYGAILENALEEINERITQDIFNLSVANDF
jgi:hypothetical protein